MGELLNFLVESILLEAAPIDKQIVVYSGRFQPFHKGHFATYQNLVKKFGSDSVYIGTSNVTDNKKSPFNFNEKKAIMMKMFGIPSSKIVNVKNPYAPSEILNKYNENKTALIVVVGEKDENRLGGKYFTPYKGKVEEPYLVRGYVYASPSQSNPISGTDVRYWLSAGSEEERKKNFTKAYPKFDDQIFKLITLKLKKLKECINEEIKLNVKVGDTLLMGKFKNKKVLVKSIGEDEWGMPTINGKKAVTFRIPKKENLKEMGLGGGAGIGLSLPGGYINGAPDSDDVKKNSKKLNNKGMSGYEEIDEIAVQIDKIPGGLANGKTLIDLANKWDSKGYYEPKQFAAEYIKPQLMKGIKVEMEHTTDVRIATEIAMDHLWEDLKYYDKLATIENTIDEATSGVLDGTPTTGATFNTTWDDFDNQDYYLHSLDGWILKHEKPSEIEKKQATDQTLPIDQQNDGKTDKYNRIEKYNFKSPSDFLKESSSKDLEKELVSLYNKAFKMMPKSPAQMKVRAEIDKVKKQIDSLKKESVNEATASDIIKDLDKVKNDLIKKVDVLIAKKKKLYSNVDIESPMSADEKQLDKDIQSIFSKIQQIIQQKRKIKESINESLLLEGGAYGHMAHPFDIEMNLTFGDLKTIVTKALNGDLELAREKTDGQALAVSWVSGRLVAARNKSHLKNKGAGAMTIGQVADKFAGRGGLTDAYNFAMQDLSKAIAALSEAQRKKIFKDGSSFMNLEVIYPTSVNVIPYNQPLLVFHGTFDYDMDGTIVGENQQAASILGGMIKQVNAHVQSKYTIQGPPMNKLPKSEDLSKLKGKYISMIGKLQSEFGLSDNDGVADYHQAWWTKFVEKGGKKLDAQEKIGLVKRWAFGDKSFRIATIQDAKLRAWAEQTDKQDQQKISKQNLMRFEEIFLGVGADVLSFMSSVLTANPDSAKRQMVARLESTIQQVKASGDPKKIEKLKLELSRLNALGGFEKIVPNEGIVFVYNGNTYKLTGAFAPLNQILGIFFDK
jgi:nicotinamide mononucleotide adenylyltransferase